MTLEFVTIGTWKCYQTTFNSPANICGTRVLNALVNARKTAIWQFGIWNILILLSLSSVLTFAQTQTQPLGIDDDARISSTLYFPDAATELDTRKALHAQIQPLVDEITQSNLTSLVRVLDRAYSAIGALHRHDAYLKVKSLEGYPRPRCEEGSTGRLSRPVGFERRY